MALTKILDVSALLLYCGFIYWLSAQQALPKIEWFAHQDKLHHFGAYFVMGLLAWRAFKHHLQIPIILALVSTVFCSLYAVSDEWHQSFVIGRSSDVFDWVADTLGASTGVFYCINYENIMANGFFHKWSRYINC